MLQPEKQSLARVRTLPRSGTCCSRTAAFLLSRDCVHLVFAGPLRFLLAKSRCIPRTNLLRLSLTNEADVSPFDARSVGESTPRLLACQARSCVRSKKSEKFFLSSCFAATSDPLIVGQIAIAVSSFRAVSACQMNNAIVASIGHHDAPRIAAHLAVLNEAAADVRLDVDFDVLAAKRTRDEELVWHSGNPTARTAVSDEAVRW